MATQPYKVAFIGAGGRSVAYASHYAQCPDISVAAIADPSKAHQGAMVNMSELPSSPVAYEDWRTMLQEHQDLDGVVITTPNHLHADQAVAVLERGLPVALEKPLATTKEDCERIVDAERTNGGRTLVGFVLRATPFYSKIHELISSGAIGRIASIQADELAGRAVTSIMNRGQWRRYECFSGGALLEKCCHDMDLLTWTMGSRPVWVNSFGDQLMMGPNPTLPDRCDHCKVAAECAYHMAPAHSSNEDVGESVLQQFVRETNVCVFNIDKDIVDTQSVQVIYENGGMANFMLNFNAMGDRAGRNFHAVGSRGRVWGNFSEAQVYHHDNVSGKTHVYDTHGDGSGHGGGDRKHALELLKMMEDASYHPASNASMGYLSASMCFAAENSRRSARRVHLRYRENGYVEFDAG